MPCHAHTEHEQIAEPEGEAREKADFCDIDRGQAIVGIDPEPDRAAREDGGADVVADGVAGEARHCSDAIGDMRLANGSQREEIIEGQRAKRADHAQRGQRDPMRGNVGERSQDNPGVDPLQGLNQMGDRKTDDEETRSDPQPFPADLLLEATPERGQQPMHSSSRRGQYVKMDLSRRVTVDGQRHRSRNP